MCLTWVGRLHLSVHTFERLTEYGIELVVYTNDCEKKINFDFCQSTIIQT